MARERRILNWEKLFAQLSVKQGHGRRWKFLIDAFKKKALQGYSKYLNQLKRNCYKSFYAYV